MKPLERSVGQASHLEVGHVILGVLERLPGGELVLGQRAAREVVPVPDAAIPDSHRLHG
eukprot:CAMPEP_0206233536 /NCGR_PEP_ID=MMETSP0047_2-20121206/12056_1 /ASSEMBLY_ACC=CAM_ASM_000192 /TAXON_ID=195065 /ORGANISM="Chroomonas mesostigmatica_cf, Strain CCMP1168" /LENGTH=58 /DNA_ID=CAMNT_0053657455 /DNA_START=162 /DNA_END=334 /DNA_ORIENTATION=+